MITITTEDAVQAVRDVVAEHPKGYGYQPPPYTRWGAPNRYGDCFYVHDSGMRDDHDHQRLVVGCIAGAALNKLGVSVDDMYEIQGTKESPDLKGFCEKLYEAGLASVAPGAVAFLRAAQIAQDEGKPWAAALRRALAHCGIQGEQDPAQ